MVAILTELTVQGIEKIAFSRVQTRCDNLGNSLKMMKLQENEFREICLRLKSFGLLNILSESSSKVADQYSIQSFVYLDEVKSAYEKNTVYKQVAHIIENNIRLASNWFDY